MTNWTDQERRTVPRGPAPAVREWSPGPSPAAPVESLAPAWREPAVQAAPGGRHEPGAGPSAAPVAGVAGGLCMAAGSLLVGAWVSEVVGQLGGAAGVAAVWGAVAVVNLAWALAWSSRRR